MSPAAAPNPFFPDVTRPLRFPRDLLRIVYWVYFRPFTLERYLQQRAPTLSLDSSLPTLWRKGREHPELRQLVYLTLFHALVTPWLAFPLAGLLAAGGVPIDWGQVLGGVLWGVLGGVLWGVLVGVLWGVLVGVLGGVSEDVLVGVSFSLGGAAGALRLHDWLLLLLPVQAGLLAGLDRAGRFVRFSPPFWHEAIVLPLPGVEAHVYRLARHDPAQGRAAVAYLAAYRYAWARKVAARVALRLMLDTVAEAHTLEGLARVYDAMQPWLLPRVRERWGEVLEPLERITGKVRAGLESASPANRAARWAEALQAVRAWQQALQTAGHALAPRLLPALASWENLLAHAVARARQQVFLPNPYIAGTPLSTASGTFKGRQDLMRRLEAEFAAFQAQRPALLLFGGRRMGKTSLLQQLPQRLGPEVVPLVLDMQGLATVGSPAAFWARLAATARRQARQHRGLQLPPVDEDALRQDPFDAFLRWLDRVEAAARGTYFLLALDEYEKLEEAIRQGRLDLRVLDVLRHMLQHRPRWLVLFSGLYTFAELPVHWSDRFINVRRFLVGPLEPDAARELVLQPTPDFAGRVHYPEAAVQQLLAQTGRQPNWMQAALRALVDRLDRERRREVTPVDVDWALEQVPQHLPGDFRFLWETPQPFPQRLDDPGVLVGYQQVLYLVAVEPGITAQALERRLPAGARALVQPTLRFFVARQMMVQENGGYRWAFPLLARWLRVHGRAAAPAPAPG